MIHRFRFSLSFFLFISSAVVRAQTDVPAVADPGPVVKLEEYKVSGQRVSLTEVAGVEPTDSYDARDIDESGAFDVGEFLEQLPPSPLGNEQLVLIDGQPTYMDISKLPPGMIEGVEVSNYGSLPQHGAYANGRVINIRLKKNYRSETVDTLFRGAFSGGGEQEGLTLSGAVTRGKWRVIYSLSYRRQEPLLASERSFSREQDHTGRGGRDLRLQWGYPAVVQAADGALAGVTDAAGNPTAVTLVPAGQDGRGLTPGNFLAAAVDPATGLALASGQRRFNTADYVTLIAPGEDWGFNFNVSRPLTPAIEATLSGTLSSKESERRTAPPVTKIGDRALVPGALNPFGEDVWIGMVHPGFGSVRQETDRQRAEIGANFSGHLSDTWQWKANVGTRWNLTGQTTHDFDQDKFRAALMAADPAVRFNPFGDDPRNADIYPTLAIDRKSEAESWRHELEATASGDLWTLAGGPMRLVTRGSYENQLETRAYENAEKLSARDSRRDEDSYRLGANLKLPWVGTANARPALQRWETELSTRYSRRSGAEGAWTQRAGMVWSPVQGLLFQTKYSVSRRAPVQYVADLQPLSGETFVDPRREPATASDVELTARDFEGTTRGRNEQFTIGATVEPAAIKGLQFSLTYDEQVRRGLLSDEFEPQDLINNELAFPGRVVRGAPSADDLLRGQPGPIVRIDTTPTDRAEQEASGLAFSLRYQRRTETLGNFRLTTSVRHPLTRRYEVVPGVPFVFESANEANPPDWTVRTQLSWNWESWHVSTSARFVDEIPQGELTQPATTDLDVRIGYRFRRPVFKKWGQDLRVTAGFGNLLEGAPPYADTLNGFRRGSPLGRTYSLTIRVPLG